VAAKMGTFLTFFTIAAAIQSVCTAEQPKAQTKAGTLLGGHCSSDTGAVFFKAIPYAEPPVGNLRLEAPKPYDGSYPNGVLNASNPAPSCIQFSVLAEDLKSAEDWYVPFCGSCA